MGPSFTKSRVACRFSQLCVAVKSRTVGSCLLGADGAAGLLHEALYSIREPMIAAGVVFVHALLNNSPIALFREKEGVVKK